MAVSSARGDLIAAKAGDPAVERRKGAAQRFDLANVAARRPVLDRLVEEIQALGADHRLHALGLGEVDLDVDLVAASNLVDQVVRLLRQPTGVEGEDPRPGLERREEVDQDDVLGTERGRDREPVPTEFSQRERENLARLERFHRDGVERDLRWHRRALGAPGSSVRAS